MALAIGIVIAMPMFASAASDSGNTVVDPDTTNVWTNFTRPDGHPSTQNVGRIWTDKSVFDDTYTFTNDNDAGLNGDKIEKDDSDFLVSLSALSSTSNLKEMVQTGEPDEPTTPEQPGTPEPGVPERPGTPVAPKIPDAGDATNHVLPAVLVAGGAALVAAALVLRARRSR